jgi:putative aldouronate transport system permease protein
MYKIKKSTEDYIIDTFVIFISIIVFFITVYPFYYALIVSFNNGTDALKGGIYLWPRKFTFDNYKAVFKDDQLFSAFIVSVLRTVIGTVTSVFATGIFAYAIAHKQLYFRKFYMTVMIIAMYVSGGIIPYFILLKNLALMNTFWVYIVPNLIGIFNVLIMISFFSELPPALEESAKIDGANNVVIFSKIIFPISAPVFATIALFNGVGQWNSWFDSAYFVTNRNLKTLAYRLMDLINKANISAIKQASGASGADIRKGLTQANQIFTAGTIRMATMIIVIIPIVLVYPFLQKYFVKGITLGAVKE